MDARPAILGRPAPAEQRISADEAVHKAERFLNRHLGHLLAAGTPQRVLFPLRSTWVVPVQLTCPTQSGDATRACTHHRRASMRKGLLSCKATTVAQPTGVRPRTCVPSALQAKCSCQFC